MDIIAASGIVLTANGLDPADGLPMMYIEIKKGILSLLQEGVGWARTLGSVDRPCLPLMGCFTSGIAATSRKKATGTPGRAAATTQLCQIKSSHSQTRWVYQDQTVVTTFKA
jgi:hypothetical protein